MDQKKRDEYGLKQLNIEIHKDLLEEIKFNAKKRNIPMRTWILRTIAKGLNEEFRGNCGNHKYNL